MGSIDKAIEFSKKFQVQYFFHKVINDEIFSSTSENSYEESELSQLSADLEQFEDQSR